MASTNTSNKSAILNKQYQTYELSQDKITVHFQNFQKKTLCQKQQWLTYKYVKVMV